MKKILLGAGVAATLSLGSVYFTGGKIIDNAISYIYGATSNIEKYEANENALVKKINEIEELKKKLQAQVTQLESTSQSKQEEIDALKNEIAKKDIEISELRELIGQTEELYDAIKRLEGQVEEANNKTDELNVALQDSNLGSPKTDEEMNDILDSTVDIKLGDRIEIFKDVYFSLEETEDRKISYKITNNLKNTIHVGYQTYDELGEPVLGSGFTISAGDTGEYILDENLTLPTLKFNLKGENIGRWERVHINIIK